MSSSGDIVNGNSSGLSVVFDPPAMGPDYPYPQRVKLTVTSSVSGLSTEEIIGVYVKISGDIDGDGLMSPTDKLILRQALGCDWGCGYP